MRRLFQVCAPNRVSSWQMRRDASPAHSLGKPLDWDTPPRAKRDLRLHAEYLDSFHEPLLPPPPADSPAQVRHLPALILDFSHQYWHVPCQRYTIYNIGCSYMACLPDLQDGLFPKVTKADVMCTA